MRTLLVTTGLSLLATAACNDSLGERQEPPVLKVTSPQRSLRQDHAGQVVVTGTVTPNELTSEPIETVLVNDVAAIVLPNGSFTAMVNVRPGATLIHTSARDTAGGEATDTRAVHAGEIRPVGANINDAITAAMSPAAFARLSAVAGPLLEGLDMGAMLAPMQPMVHVGAEKGAEDCAFGSVYVEDVDLTNAEISITPTNTGLKFRAELDGLAVSARARFAVFCATLNETIRINATRVVVAGTLVVTPGGNQGFKTALTGETVQITGLDIQASGVPGTILDLIHLDSVLGTVISKVAPLAMEPLMNKALGGLAGPQVIDVLGKKLHIEVDPTAIDVDANGALVTLSTKMLIAGSESSPGFTFTDSGMPSMDAGSGIQLGLADDLANELLAEATALGMLAVSMPAHGGSFDNTAIAMTLPPMISADPADGMMKLILGDMAVTFTDHGLPVAKVAINAMVELQVVPASNGYGVALQLGKPTIQADVLDDVVNATRLTSADLAQATEVSLGAQIDSVSKLLTSIPLPAVAGLQMRNVHLGADDGYVMMKGDIE